jgi:two-component system response regulator HydG
LLADHFIDKHSKELNKKIQGIHDAALQKLMGYDWPGNVRELENAMERACVLTKGALIISEDLPGIVLNGKEKTEGIPASAAVLLSGNGATLKNALRDPEKKLILDALEKAGWNKKEAAKILGINRTTLYKKLNEYGIDPSPQKVS